MHRKIFAVILAGVLSLLTLTACGTSESRRNGPRRTTSSWWGA